MDYLELGYIGLFLVSFVSATLIPLASEGVLMAFLAIGYHPVNCILVATIGNTLGSYLNYAIGWIGNTKWLVKFGFSERHQQRFSIWIQAYGHWLGALSWVPFIGDPLTLALGFFKTRVIPTLTLILLSKGIRYIIIWWIWNSLWL